MKNSPRESQSTVPVQKRVLLHWEQDFLDKYASAIDNAYVNSRDEVFLVISNLRIAVESLLKAICTAQYRLRHDEDIVDVHTLMETNRFWGQKVGDGFKYWNNRLSIIHRAVKVINSLGNNSKHKKYTNSYLESLHSLTSMHVVTEWYFKDFCKYQEIEMKPDQQLLIENVFRNLHIPKEIESLLSKKDQQLEELRRQNFELIQGMSKIGKIKAAGGLISPVIEADKYSLEREVTEIKKVLKKFPNDQLYNRAGFLLYNLAIREDLDEQKIDEARKMLLNAIQLNRYNFEAFNNLGNVLAKQGDLMDNEILYLDAIDKYKVALRINEGFFYAYYNCGTAYQKLSLYKDGKEKIEVLLAALNCYLNGEKLSDGAMKNYQSYNISCIYSGLGKLDESFEYLQKAIQYDKSCLEKIYDDPDFDNLRNDNRFVNFINSISPHSRLRIGLRHWHSPR